MGKMGSWIVRTKTSKLHGVSLCLAYYCPIEWLLRCHLLGIFVSPVQLVFQLSVAVLFASESTHELFYI